MNICLTFLMAARMVARRDKRPTDVGCAVLGDRWHYSVEGPLGGIVWEGKACCRYCARTSAIFALGLGKERRRPDAQVQVAK